MPSFDDFIVFVDESGDHGLATMDPHYPIFVLAFCLFRKDRYAREIVPALLDLKFKHFGHDQVILHEREIRKREGDFQILNDPETRTEFHADLDRLVGETRFTLLASVIDKVALNSSYQTPDNPYHLAMAFGLERVYLHLQKATQGTVWFVFEKRGDKEDDDLELQFRRICESNATGNQLPFKIRFASKLSNSSGLQFADLIARPIGRHHLKPEQPNRAHEIIDTKFRKSPDGKLLGWGLKVFP